MQHANCVRAQPLENSVIKIYAMGNATQTWIGCEWGVNGLSSPWIYGGIGSLEGASVEGALAARLKTAREGAISLDKAVIDEELCGREATPLRAAGCGKEESLIIGHRRRC